MGREFDRSVIVGIVLLTALVVSNATISYWNTRHVHDDAHLVAHSREVLEAAASVRTNLRAMEATQRFFVLAGDDLAAFRQTEAATREQLARLTSLTRDNADQQAKIAELDTAVGRAVAQLNETVRVRQAEGLEPAARTVAQGVTRRHVKEADRILAEFDRTEHRLLEARRVETERAYSNALFFGAASAAFGLIAVGTFVVLLRRSWRTRGAVAAAVGRERQWLRTTLASIGDGVIATDAGGNVTFLNPVAETLTGWQQPQAQGVSLTRVFNIVNETTRVPVENPALRALKEGVIVGLANHTILIARDGVERPIDDSAAPIRDEAGTVGGAVLVFRDISDRKTAEEELARAHAETARQKRLYDTILSATPDFVYVFSLHHTVLYANPPLVAMWGTGDPVGKTFLEIGYPAWHAEMHDREIDTVRATKKPIRGEVHFDGTLGRRIYDYIFVPVSGADGEVEAIAGTTRDVTERKAGEEKLRLLDAVGEAVRPAADPVAVMVATTRLLGEHLKATRVAYADLEPDNNRFTIRHDWTTDGAASTVGTYSLDAFGPRAAAELRAGKTLVVRDVDAELAPAEGADTFKAIGIKAIVCCPLVKGGRLLAMMAAHQDIPRDWTPGEAALVEEMVERSWAHVERVGAAAVVRESAERFRIVARATNDAVWDWDTRTDAVWWNEGVTTLFGYRREDVGPTAAWWNDHIHPDDRGRVVSDIHAVIDRGGANWSAEYRYRKADGTYAAVFDRGYAIHEGGKTVRLVGAMQDVTDRRRSEERLRRSEEQYRSLFTSIDQGFCVVEMLFDGDRPVDYRFREANPTFGRQTGLADAVGKTARELVPTLEDRWFEVYGKVARTGEPARFEMGSEAMGRWFEVHAARVGPAANRAVAILFTDVSQRKAAERERERLLKEVEAERGRLADVFRHAPTFMGVLRGPDHVFERANDQYLRLVGGRELVGKPVREALPEVVGQGYIDLLDRVYRTGEPYAASGAQVTFQSNGSLPETRHLDFVYQPLRDTGGEVNGIIVQGVDQTDRVRAEAAIRERDERLQLFLGAASDYAVIICDPDDRVTEWLGGAARITGWREEEVIGRPVSMIFTPEDCKSGVPDQETEKATRNGRAENTRWHQRKDGSQFFAEGVTVGIRSPGGELRGFGKVFRDRTDRKRAEDAVRFLADASASLAELVDYESTLRRIADIAVGGFADWCVVDLLENGTRQRLAVTRSESDEVTAARAEDAPTDGVIPHVLRTGEPEVVTDVTAMDADAAPQGAERVAKLRGMGVRSYLCVPLLSRGRVIGGMTFLSHSARRRFGPDELRVAQDLADRVTSAIENAQLYRVLQEQDRRKGEFLATLAHELRNPLAPVKNGVTILKTGRQDAAAMERALAMMDRQLGHMVHLVDDLLDVSRVSSGKVVLRKERVELRAVVEAAVETTRQAVEAGHHELTVTLPAEPLAFDADRTRLSQVLANLLNNAAKYTPAGGQIELSATRDGDEAVIRVTDTGVGIPADMLSKVFEMFTQVGTSLERSQGGLGIGLTLVKRLVEMHGGRVTAESRGIGQGSTFTVRLPLAVGQAVLDSSPAPQERAVGVKLKLLVVDDNHDAAESLAMLLGMKGHEVKTVHDGPEALRTLGTYCPDLVLLDLGLPGMSGYEVARMIRESHALKGVTLAALTGWGQDEDRRRTKEAGFDHHLVKPADLAEIDGILRSLGGG